ncbi:hypothetical protein QOZ88_05970 [Blastococcus sp. BMG 814]|uniref:Tail terminator n=1 Tax=Blastococcus carthaginiensis TaxID=3050034 RepID=A0ABT9I9C8_9ACTN|nr:hypothetical protein [Blastococcus carthaginiensis]MDP5182177.1 hypothetical protein [Blastococcus carthaginiensis]
MKPLVVFGDAQAAAIGVLRAGFAAHPQPYATGVTIGTRVPGDRSPETPRLPFVLVALDGTPRVEYPVNARAALRITVWHRTEADAHDLAQLAMSLLLVHTGAVLRSVRPGAGVAKTVDPTTGIDLATFTVAANVRPVAVETPTT